MIEKDTDQHSENFSVDPIENLRIENEILKLKMQAQFGAIFGGTEAEFPPEIENEFLQSIQRFEETWQDVKLIKVYDLLGRPDFEKAENVSPEDTEVELMRLQKLLEEKKICLDALGKYEPSVIYRFITEEFFQHETEYMPLAGFVKTFVYEEFHPNHKMDLKNVTQDFLTDWFNKNFDEYSMEFNQMIVTAESNPFTVEEVIDKLNKALVSYVSFSNERYKILDTSFEWNIDENRGMGFTEGVVEYNAHIKSGGWVYVNGPFKFYFCNNNGYWNIFYFILPGFEW